MKKIPTGQDLKDLIIECALVVAEDVRLCELMLLRNEIAFDHQMTASEILAELN